MKKGFTLVELVIVIIIVGILSIVAVPIYKGYTDRAKESEGKALLGSINTSQKVYFAEHNAFYGPVETATDNIKDLSIDARANKYYRTFTLAVSNVAGTDEDSNNSSFTAIVEAAAGTTGSANLKPITLIANSTGTPRITGGVAGNSDI